MISKQLQKADLAYLAGVSRAAISKWFCQKEGWVNVETQTLLRLAQGLGVSPDIFLQNRMDMKTFETSFLWDRLYPSMEIFIKALIEDRLQAVARLVQVLGFRDAMTVIGKKAVVLFDKYKKYLKPMRRKQLEILWPLYISQI